MVTTCKAIRRPRPCRKIRLSRPANRLPAYRRWLHRNRVARSRGRNFLLSVAETARQRIPGLAKGDQVVSQLGEMPPGHHLQGIHEGVAAPGNSCGCMVTLVADLNARSLAGPEQGLKSQPSVGHRKLHRLTVYRDPADLAGIALRFRD